MTHTDLFSTGIRPAIDEHLLKLAQEKRDYGKYWSASSAGYCMRKNIFDRLKVPHVKDDARTQRVFTVGHIFHSWIQGLTSDANLSIVQEGELINDDIMVKGHFDDVILINNNLIVYDYKSQNSGAFTASKIAGKGMSHYHRMQLGTYIYMMRSDLEFQLSIVRRLAPRGIKMTTGQVGEALNEGRILKISKDDLRMSEQQLIWSLELESDVVKYWGTLNGHWKASTLPDCTCADHENGFMAKEKYNPYYFDGEPCSLAWLKHCIEEGWVDYPGGKI